MQRSVSARLTLLGWLLAAPATAQPSARFDDVPPSRAPPRTTRPSSSAERPATPAATPRTSDITPRGPSLSWATTRAREFVRTAERHEQRGDAAFAISAYSEAIRMDGTYGAAYLGLARLREAIGDASEAERLYAMGIRISEIAPEAYARRARMRRRLGQEADALLDMEAAVRLEPEARERLRELASWYVELHVWPAALSIWRRLLERDTISGDATALSEARVQVRALSLLAGDSDPVQNAGADPSWVRRALANIARRAGR